MERLDPGWRACLDDRVLGGREFTDVVEPRVPSGGNLGGVEVVLQGRKMLVFRFESAKSLRRLIQGQVTSAMRGWCVVEIPCHFPPNPSWKQSIL